MIAPTRARVPCAPDSLEWLVTAACRGADPDLFVPDLVTDRATGDVDLRPLARTAWTFCQRCPALPRCHDLAERVPGTVGIWGGSLRRLKSAGSAKTVRLPLVPAAPKRAAS